MSPLGRPLEPTRTSELEERTRVLEMAIGRILSRLIPDDPLIPLFNRGEELAEVVACNSPTLSNIVVLTKLRGSEKLNLEPSLSKHNEELKKKNAELEKQLKDIQKFVDKLKSPRSCQHALDLDSALLNLFVTAEPYQEGFKIPHSKKVFPSMLKSIARRWYHKLPRHSITSYFQLVTLFSNKFVSQQEIKHTTIELMQVHHKEGELLRDYIQQFNKATLDIDNILDTICLSTLLHGLKPVWQNKEPWHQEGREEKKKQKVTEQRGKPTGLPKYANYTSLTSSRSQSLAQIHHWIKRPPFPYDQTRADKSKYYGYHRGYSHHTEDCQSLKDELEYLTPNGKLEEQIQKSFPQVITLPIYMGTEPWFRMVSMSFLIVKMESAFNAIIGRATLCELKAVISQPHLCMEFPTPYGIGVLKGNQKMTRTCYHDTFKKAKPIDPVETVPLDPEEQKKRVKIGTKLTTKERRELFEFLKANKDVFAWTTDEMPRIPTEFAVHKLSTDPMGKPMVQKRRLFGPEKQVAMDKEIQKLLQAGFIRKVEYSKWVSNPVLVKKPNGSAMYPKLVQLVFKLQIIRNIEVYVDDMIITKKAAFALVCIAWKLRAYFQSAQIVVFTDLPLRKILQKLELSSRLIGWVAELSEYDVRFEPHTIVKGQALAYFLVECHLVATEETVASHPIWALYVDGVVNTKGSRAGAVLVGPHGFKSEHALRFKFQASNNAAKYEALVYRLKLVTELGVQDIRIFSDFQLVVNQVNGNCEVKDPQLAHYCFVIWGLESSPSTQKIPVLLFSSPLSVSCYVGVRVWVFSAVSFSLQLPPASSPCHVRFCSWKIYDSVLANVGTVHVVSTVHEYCSLGTVHTPRVND
ncbi:hypothetical protein SLEP1_g27803 [Rubroshorea leprosula]|uniref:Retrotransposon gag domain-containing protein n=1 Tax=Rubroshorea leprosula TaxID=152421 RepID=A0AAV5JRI6_9ROSI|nr:hypothetical protein SLEP1_g27803 [Rubroshorea leprosula]